MSWADRIAYVCHDFEDAVSTGIVSPAMLPPIVREPLRISRQLGAFIGAVVDTGQRPGVIGMDSDTAEALAALPPVQL